MENTLTLYVRYLAKPGCRETFLRQLTTHGIIDAIRREDGCLRYDSGPSSRSRSSRHRSSTRAQHSRRSISGAKRWKYPSPTSCAAVSSRPARYSAAGRRDSRRRSAAFIWRMRFFVIARPPLRE